MASDQEMFLEHMVRESEDSWRRELIIANGPIIRDGIAYLPPEKAPEDTTPHVDYDAISHGQLCPWFQEAIVALRKSGVAHPCYSHGFDRHLTNIHVNQPNLSYAFTDESPDGKETVTLYEITHYQSVGVWVDTEYIPCLPIRAHFSDGVYETRLLYSADFREDAKLVDKETQWVTRKGRNPGVPKDFVR